MGINNPSPAPPGHLSLDEAAFWVTLTIFGTGLYLVSDHPLWGAILMAVGVIGLIYAIRKTLPIAGYKTWIVVVSLLVATPTIGYDVYLRLTSPEAPIPTAQPSLNPLHNDASRWRLVHGLSLDTPLIKGVCVAHIHHYQVPYSESFADDLKQVLDVVGWKTYQSVFLTKFPQGVSIRVRDEISGRCAERLRSRLDGIRIAVPMIETVPQEIAPTSPDFSWYCPGCFEIRIGNEPGQ